MQIDGGKVSPAKGLGPGISVGNLILRYLER